MEDRLDSMQKGLDSFPSITNKINKLQTVECFINVFYEIHKCISPVAEMNNLSCSH